LLPCSVRSSASDAPCATARSNQSRASETALDKLSPERETALLALLRGNASAREAAFAELVRALHRPLAAVCLHITGNRSDADDALQDTLLGLHQALPAFRGEARISTLAHRIALRSSFRLKAARPRSPAPLDQAEQLARSGAPTDEHAAARQAAARMIAALETLSADDRAVIVLFAVEGLAHKEIAEILALPEGTVWYRLHRARQALRALAGLP